MAQVGKSLYILGGGAVHCLNTETGETAELFETSADFLDADGGGLALFGSESSEFLTYDLSGRILSEIPAEGITEKFADFAVCGECFVLLCGDELFSLGRDGAIISEIKAKRFTKKLCAYSGGKALVYAGDAAFGHTLYEFDAKSGALTKLRDLPQLTNVFVMTFNPKSGTVIILGDDGHGRTALYEYALDSEDNGVLKKFDIKSDLSSRKFVSAYENIVSAVWGDEAVYRFFDYENPPEAVTLAYIGEENAQNCDLETIILDYEAAHDAIIRTVCYNDDRTRLSLKLMAGDSDIDIFSTMSIDGCLFISSGMFTDLSVFPSLSGKIKANLLTDFASGFNGKYIGLPYGIRLAPDEQENVSGLTAVEQYCIKNVDALNKRFSDSGGEELYKIMKFAAENPEPKRAYYDFPYSTLWADYLIINPASERKELAADFLEYAFDVYSGNIAPAGGDNGGYSRSPLMFPYPELADTENLYLEINFRPWSVVEPIFTAFNKAKGADISKSELKKLAKEAASEATMRLEE